ncbi:MAG: hypothetical protein QXI19_13695 [Candidatus Caldarchaeum sp.]
MPLWNEALQSRWNALSRKRMAGQLSETEQQEWDQLCAILDAEELEMLQPAFQHYDEQNAALEQELEKARQEKTRLEALLQARVQERLQLEVRLRELEQEYQRLLKQRQPAPLSEP